MFDHPDSDSTVVRLRVTWPDGAASYACESVLSGLYGCLANPKALVIQPRKRVIETYGTKVRSTLLTTSTLTRKSMTDALDPFSLEKASSDEPEDFADSPWRALDFCDVVRRSAKREEKIAQRCSPSFSRIKSAAYGSSLELAFSDFCR